MRQHPTESFWGGIVKMMGLFGGIGPRPVYTHPVIFAVTRPVTIALCLFVFQYKGTDKVAGVLGTSTVPWYFALAISGIVSIIMTMPDSLMPVGSNSSLISPAVSLRRCSVETT